MSYVAPKLGASSFTCPHCSVYAQQHWPNLYQEAGNGARGFVTVDLLSKSVCRHCQAACIWMEKKIVFPEHATAPMPHADLPDDCKADYLEARNIISRSPRGAAALLRLVIQKLMPHIGEKGKNIDADIASLVQKGLPVEVQQALDACRVIGNNAVHPGEIDLTATPDLAVQMCELINFIVENRIAQPKKIKAIYSALPSKNLNAIQARDGIKGS